MSSSYRVEFTVRAAREFLHLPRAIQRRLRPRIDALAVDPRPPQSRPLEGYKDAWRLRVGEYRVLYEIRDDVLRILVIRVAHRGRAYRRR